MRIFNPKKMRKVVSPTKPAPKEGAGKVLLRKMANEIVDATAVVLEKAHGGLEKLIEKIRGQVEKVETATKKVETKVVAVAESTGRIEEELEAQRAIVQALAEMKPALPEPRPKKWTFEVTRLTEGKYRITAEAA